ncbi:hypothetical protein C8J57DRAFT_1297427, partial [Mycena rebaudengoi]
MSAHLYSPSVSWARSTVISATAQACHRGAHRTAPDTDSSLLRCTSPSSAVWGKVDSAIVSVFSLLACIGALLILHFNLIRLQQVLFYFSSVGGMGPPSAGLCFAPNPYTNCCDIFAISWILVLSMMHLLFLQYGPTTRCLSPAHDRWLRLSRGVFLHLTSIFV